MLRLLRQPPVATESIAHEMLAMTLKEQSVFERLSQEICHIKFRIDLFKLKNALLTCIVNKMLAEINVLSTITATNRAFGPMNARLIISKNRSWTILLKTKVSKKQ